MELSLFLSLLGFLWVAAITPGPNNMLLTASGANFGFFAHPPVDDRHYDRHAANAAGSVWRGWIDTALSLPASHPENCR